MIILPIGHEQKTVRRWPWVTFTLIALCVLVFIAERGSSSRLDERVEELFEKVLLYYSEHPYLELDRALMAMVFSTTPENEEQVENQLRSYLGEVTPPSTYRVHRQQERLDEMTAELLAEVRKRPIFRYGLIPASLRPLSLLTYMFFHGGLLHLLGNLFFLYLTAPFIEDVWGRSVFGVFYLLVGVLAAVFYAFQYPHLQVPLIGASGAIAGVMGAFMVRYAKTRISFFYFVWFFRLFVGTFEAPAILMLLLWVGGEMWSAYLMDSLAPGSGGGGVAHWAHVWGFAFGVVGAFVAGALKIEQKHVQKTGAGEVENTSVELAHRAASEGRAQEAWGLLTEELGRHPSNRDAALALWDLGMSGGRAAEAAPVFARAIRQELADGEVELALFHWRELTEREPGFTPELGVVVRLAQAMHAESGDREAEAMVRRALERLDGTTGSGVVLRLFHLASKLDPALGAEVAGTALERCQLPAEMEAELRQELGTEPPPPPPERAPLQEAQAPPEPRLRVLPAVPLAIGGGSLCLEMEGGRQARLRLDHVRALAAVGIREPEAVRPYLLIDLFLDRPGSDAGDRELRVVRCRSGSFDPRSLLAHPAAEMDVKTGFQMLIERLLAETGARPLLGSDRFGRQAIPIFPSLESYQSAIGSWPPI